MTTATLQISSFRWSLSRQQQVGLLMLVIVVAFALIEPLVGPEPHRQDLAHNLERPSWAHPMGTDHLGRSMVARLAHAAQLSLTIALLTVLTAAALGAS